MQRAAHLNPQLLDKLHFGTLRRCFLLRLSFPTALLVDISDVLGLRSYILSRSDRTLVAVISTEDWIEYTIVRFSNTPHTHSHDDPLGPNPRRDGPPSTIVLRSACKCERRATEKVRSFLGRLDLSFSL